MQLNEQKRERLLALLNGSEKALRLIEAAIARYIELLPIAREAMQKPSEIKKEADDLHLALKNLVRIIASGGEAWEYFKAGAMADGLALPLHQLTEALGSGASESGEALVFAASQSADDLKPTQSRPKSADKISRFIFLFHLANAAREANVLISRNSKQFQEIIDISFEAVNIVADPEHDIRKYLQAFSQ